MSYFNYKVCYMKIRKSLQKNFTHANLASFIKLTQEI